MISIESITKERLEEIKKKFPQGHAYLMKVDRIQKGIATKEEVASYEKSVKEFSKRDKVTLIDGLG